VAVDAERKVLRIDGNAGGVSVSFPHASHQERLGGQASCVRCHHVSLPTDHSTPCSRCHRDMEAQTQVFRHAAHFEAVAQRDRLEGWVPQNHACASCHVGSGPKSAANARPCLDCHQKDMAIAREVAGGPLALGRARGYRSAMHTGCVACHKTEAVALQRPALAECGTCHETLRRREVPRQAGIASSLVATRLR
jgi:hypothetical protein